MKNDSTEAYSGRRVYRDQRTSPNEWTSNAESRDDPFAGFPLSSTTGMTPLRHLEGSGCNA